MQTSFTVLLTLFLATLTACGGSSDGSANDESSNSTTALSQHEPANAESFLSVTIDGSLSRSQSRVKESGVKFGDRLDAVLIADSFDDPSGLPELSISIITPSRKTGTFEIVFNQNKINRAEGKDIAIVQFSTGSEDTRMQGLNGTLNISTLETTPQAGNYRIIRLVGSFEGSFRTTNDGDKPVQGSFDFSR